MKNIILLAALVLTTLLQLNAGPIGTAFFDKVDDFVSSHVKNGLVDYTGLADNKEFQDLIDIVENADLSGLDSRTLEAFYINAYNLQVIQQAAQSFPLNSVQEISGFFDKKKVTVAGERTTLNQLEKNKLLSVYKDARHHFVLVCGALGCPPIIDEVYRPETLDQQLERQTKKALNDNNFLEVNGNQVKLSKIFEWYPGDFGGSKKSIISFINKYRSQPLSTSSKISYYNYDWTLNDKSASTSQTTFSKSGGNNASRYIVSSTIPAGTSEIKIFNNLYTQSTGADGAIGDRSTFFTTSLSYLFGVSNRVNIGLSTRYRRVRNSPSDLSQFEVFSGGDELSSRSGLTAIGPQVRIAPVPKWSNFSIQSSFVLPIGENLSGGDGSPFIDWNGATWWTQFFNDFSIGQNFSLFTEVDFLVEDIGSSSNGHINRVSTPATAIFSYNPTPNSTIYALGGFSPFWQSDFDYFTQVGVGAKYQITPDFELEVLVTDFSNQFLANVGGQASTLNFGIRTNL